MQPPSLLKIIAGLTAILVLCGFLLPQAGAPGSLPVPLPVANADTPQRLVSLAPGITEILFGLAAGDLVKGVTKYCAFPKAAGRLPKVGGYYDLNYEAVLALRPDLVILLPAQQEQRLRLQRMGLHTYTVDLNTLSSIMSSVLMLGLICHQESQAAIMIRQFEQNIMAAAVPAGRKRSRVMVVIDRDYDQSGLHGVTIVGQGDFYGDLLKLAGGENVFRQDYPRYPQLSLEGIRVLNPDVIIELIAEPEKIKRSQAQLLHDWAAVPGLKAYQNGQIHLLTGDYTVIPGPRLIQLFNDLKKAVPSGASR